MFLRQLKSTNEHGYFDVQVLLKVNAKALNEKPGRSHDLLKNFAHWFVHVSLNKAEGQILQILFHVVLDFEWRVFHHLEEKLVPNDRMVP